MSTQELNLSDFIRAVPDWPKKGIMFRDITPLLADTNAFDAAVQAIIADYRNEGIDYVAAVEARGFIFGSTAAQKLGAGFIPIRKKGKLPCKTETVSYDLEYGTDTLEVHSDAVTAGKPHNGTKILMVDDLLATGGTMSAACELIEKVGGKIAGLTFLIELEALAGREKLSGYKISTVLKY